jgi:hypothetical protein
MEPSVTPASRARIIIDLHSALESAAREAEVLRAENATLTAQLRSAAGSSSAEGAATQRQSAEATAEAAASAPSAPADARAAPAPAPAPAVFLYDGADPNAGLVGRCSTCRGPTRADVELCRCGRVNHRRCLASVARGRRLCGACVARDRSLPDVLTVVEVCAGMATTSAALHVLSLAGALSGFVALADVECAHPARKYLENLGEVMPGVRPRYLIDNLLHVRTAERADLCFAGARAGLRCVCALGLTAALRTQVCRAASSATTLTATPTFDGGWTTQRPTS